MKTITNFLVDHGVVALFGLLLAFIIVGSVHRSEARPEARPETRGSYFFSFETGCYVAYENECERLEEDKSRAKCFQRGLDLCEDAAKHFADWIERDEVE